MCIFCFSQSFVTPFVLPRNITNSRQWKPFGNRTLLFPPQYDKYTTNMYICRIKSSLVPALMSCSPWPTSGAMVEPNRKGYHKKMYSIVSVNRLPATPTPFIAKPPPWVVQTLTFNSVVLSTRYIYCISCSTHHRTSQNTREEEEKKVRSLRTAVYMIPPLQHTRVIHSNKQQTYSFPFPSPPQTHNPTTWHCIILSIQHLICPHVFTHPPRPPPSACVLTFARSSSRS